MKKRNDKGFTLVELIVVLVILAILAAILVPALLGYIDKAREKQVTTNAEAAYVAAQAYWTECYGKNANAGVPGVADTKAAIQRLTDITESFDIEVAGGGQTNSTVNKASRSSFIIGTFVYKQTSGNNKKKASWNPSTGEWTVTDN